jgi:toxin HigB-1
VIKSFRHKGLERFYSTGKKAGIQPAHADKLRLQLAKLDPSSKPEDLNLPGWRFHRLHGQDKGRCAVSVNGNWRLTFEFDGPDAVLVDYEDYH